MDISSTSAVAGYASSMSSSKSANEVGVVMLNKALDIQEQSAGQLIASVSETQGASETGQSLPEHLGRFINVTA